MKKTLMLFIIIILAIIMFLIMLMKIKDVRCKRNYTDEIERRLLIYEQSYDNYCLEDALKQQEE